ncbi:MAG TPA: LegC family aminotransferase [Gemmatimonadales bacterium]|nr:LegC family aminotransferase [Gemmatimonadales bacterium]
MCEPYVAGNEWRYVKECLDTGWVSSVGSFVDRFEKEFAARVGVRFAVAMSSGTAALHIAALVAGIEPGDEVVAPAVTFIAPLNAMRYAGAWPTVVDVEPDYWQLDAREARRFLADDCERRDGVLVNRHTGRRVRALMPVDILGHPVELDAIHALADEFALTVIEDATESLGARYQDRPLGQRSPITCFSFNGNKLITTGGGGMLVCDDETTAKRARYLATQAKDDPLEYVHGIVGYNYRLTNVLAAMGCAQLEQLDAFIAKKRGIAARYTEALRDVPGITPMREAPWAFSAFWLFTVLVDEGRFGMDSRALLRRLADAKIQCRPLWQPMHQSAAHAGSWSRACPVAESIHARALSLPCSVGLTDGDQERVIAAIRAAAR